MAHIHNIYYSQADLKDCLTVTDLYISCMYDRTVHLKIQQGYIIENSPKVLEIWMYIQECHSEGSVSQICYLALSFYFMKSRK